VLSRLHSKDRAGFFLFFTLLARLSQIACNPTFVPPLSSVSYFYKCVLLLTLSQSNWKVYGKHIERRRRKKRERQLRL